MRVVIACALLTLVSCTEPVQRRPSSVEVRIDADAVVRMHTVRVEVEVETQERTGAGWENAERKAFRPDPTEILWPIRFKVQLSESAPTPSFNLVATAFDKQGSVVARAQAIREPARALKSGLRVRFEGACFRQPTLCSDGETCSAGSCVSARDDHPLAETDEETETTSGAATTVGSATAAAEDGLAEQGGACSGDARACLEHGSVQPLRCEDGAWRTADACGEEERCDTSAGSTRGTCQPIARECLNQKPNIAFCDSDTMRVCADLVRSQIRPCAENQHCVPGSMEAECGCRPGFVADGALCRAPTGCGADRGGCDPHTNCSVTASGRSCSDCPPEYSGTGLEGCAPLLRSLVASAGTITPAVSRDTFEYRIRVPIVAPTLTLTAAGPDAETRIAFDAVAVPAGESWHSPILPAGETHVELTLTSKIGVANKYAITIERTVEPAAIIKTNNLDANDGFGSTVASSGTMLIAGAINEDGAPSAAGGDASSNTAVNSGAAYVFERRSDGWTQTAYLKASAGEAGDLFGGNVAIDGDTIVVTASRAYFDRTRDANAKSGVAYVFKRSGTTWKETQRIVPSRAEAGDLFGLSVGLSGDSLIIGAMHAAASNGDRSGVVYSYERTGDVFAEKQILTPRETAGLRSFGASVEIEKDRLVIGAPYDAGNRGSAWVFVRRDGTWTEEQRLGPATSMEGMTFGSHMELRGKRIAIGAPRLPWPPPPYTGPTPPGEVYLFELEGDHWEQAQVLRAPSAGNSDFYGFTIEMTDTLLVIGAMGEAGSSRGVNGDPARKGAAYSGAVFQYGRVGDTWKLSDYLKASNAGANEQFGWSIAVVGEELVAGTPYDSSGTPGVHAEPSGTATSSGALYVFH